MFFKKRDAVYFGFSSIWFLFFLFLVSRIFFFLLAMGVRHSLHLNVTDSTLFALIDGYWYIDIAQHGYDTHARAAIFLGHQNYVFFPLYPLLIKGVMLFTGLKAAVCGQLVSNACFFASLCLFYAWMQRRCGAEAARIGSILLAFSPYNIYFMAVYTESLFLLLLLLFWLAAEQKRWLWMGVCGFLLGLTHPEGVVSFIFAAWFMWDDYRIKRKNVLQYWPIFLIPLSVVSYMIYLHFHVGDALAFVHNEQQAWHRDGWHFGKLGMSKQPQIQGDTYNLFVYVLALILSGFLWVRGYRKEALLIPLFSIPALLSGTFVALARYVGTLFPFYIGASLFVVEKNGLKFVLGAEALGMVLLMYAWLEQAPAAF